MEKNKIHSEYVFLAATVVVGVISVVTATIGTATSIAVIPSAYADANCDKANAAVNEAGNTRGNPKQCPPFSRNTEGEQPRSCDSPNRLKDNDGDSFAYCIGRPG